MSRSTGPSDVATIELTRSLERISFWNANGTRFVSVKRRSLSPSIVASASADLAPGASAPISRVIPALRCATTDAGAPSAE